MKLQDLRQPPQDLHLAFARGGPLGLGLELLQDRHDARGGAPHVEVAHLREVHDLGVGDHAHHRVAMRAAGFEVGQDRGDVLLEEEQVRDHDVGVPDRVLRAVERARGFGPFGGGKDFDGQTREILGQRRRDTRGRTRRNARRA
jgi:hypothetical protein